MIKAIFFDFDLTLVNSRPGAKATYKALWKLTNQKTSKKGFQAYVGSRFSEMVDELNKRSGVSKKTIISTFNRIYASKIPKMKFYGKKLFPKLREVKVIILSNNTKTAIKKVCSYYNIKYYALYADEDMAKNETKANAISRTLRRLKLNRSEALYVGDHINDVIESHKAGIKAVIVPTGVFKKLYIMRYHPDFMISSLNKLTKLLKPHSVVQKLFVEKSENRDFH